MSIYYNASGETKEIDDAVYAAWTAAGNPKASAWTLRPDPPAYDPATHTCTWTGTSWDVQPIPVVVPESVPAHQFYAALEDMGAMPAVQAYIYGADERTKMFFQKAPYFRRDAAGIEAGRRALLWSRAQVDQLFINAGNLTP